MANAGSFVALSKSRLFAFCIVSGLEVSEASVMTQFTTFSTVCLHDAKQEPLQIKSLYKHISHSSGGGTATHVAKLFLLRKSCVRYGWRFAWIVWICWSADCVSVHEIVLPRGVLLWRELANQEKNLQP